MSDSFNPDNAVAVDETPQGPKPVSGSGFNIDSAQPVETQKNGSTDFESFRDSPASLSQDAPKTNQEPPDGQKNTQAAAKGQPGGKDEALKGVSKDGKPYQEVIGPQRPPEDWLNATLHLSEGATWNTFVKPFSKPQPDMDQYLSDLEKNHPIGAIVGGISPFIVSAPFVPESLLPNIYARFSAQFGLVGLGAGINASRADKDKSFPAQFGDVAGETIKQAGYGPIFAKAQALKILDRPVASALARAGIITSAGTIWSTAYGTNLVDAFKNNGLYGALSMIMEAPHLASTTLGRGIIAHANSLYADLAVKRGYPDLDINVDRNYTPEATDELSTQKYHVREISDLLSVSDSPGQLAPGENEGEYTRLPSGWPDFLTDRGYSRADLNTIFDKFLNDEELTPGQKTKLDTILKDAEPFTKGLSPIQKQLHTITTALANEVPGIHDQHIIAATVKLKDGTEIHGASHADALAKLGPNQFANEIEESAKKITRPGETVAENVQRTKDWIMSTLRNDENSTDQELKDYFKSEGGFSDEVAQHIVDHRGKALNMPLRAGADKAIDAAIKTLPARGSEAGPITEIPEVHAARKRALEIKHTDQINTPERQALRQQIADRFYGQGAKNKDKRLDLVLGLPAAGKGKFLKEIVQKFGSTEIDNDQYKEALPEYENGVGAYAVHKESEMIEDQVMTKAVGNNDNLAIAWLGKNPDKLDRYIKLFKQLGYNVHLTNVELPVEEAMSRAVTRFQEIGRFVDPAYISEIGLRTLKNNDMLEMDARLDSYEKYSNDVPKGSPARHIKSIFNKDGQRSGQFVGGLSDQHVRARTPAEEAKAQVITPGFTVLSPDGSTRFIHRPESQKQPFNLKDGHSEDVPGLNESKWQDHQEPKITNPDTLAMVANNEGKVDIRMITPPGLPEAAEILQKSHEELKEKFLPYTIGKEGPFASEVIRENLGIMARAYDKMEASTSTARKIFDKANKESSLEFVYDMEEGKTQKNKDLEKIAAVGRDILDSRRNQIIDLGTNKLENWIENYFPHVWEDPNKVGKLIKMILGKRPFAGPASFLKKRTIPTTREGIELGFTPVSYNPIDMILLKAREMDRYIMAHKSIQALKDQGLIKFVRTGEKSPEGFVPIDDRFAQVTYKNDAKELVLAGKYMAQRDAGRILNNYLSPGLRGKSYIYDMYRGAGNTLNQFQLGISAFHLGFTSMDATVSKFALGINKLSNKDYAGAIKEFGRAPFAPITNIMQGRELLQAWYGKDMGELTNTIANLMASGGGRAKMDKFYATGMRDSMNKSLKEGKILTASLKVPFYIVDQLSRPIMEYIVPRQKMGVFMDMMKMELEKNPDISHEQLRGIAQKAWDSVDNRMGQLVYDNLFWNRTVKDLSMASVRSLGWNLGTIREIGGGVKDVIGNVEDLIHGRGTRVSYRTAYVMALPIVTGLYGAIYQYLHTGQIPQDAKDYFFPRNGAIDNKGMPARVSLPTYMKDIYHYTTNPVQTVINKFSPVNNAVLEMMMNRDFYGTQIRNVDDPVMQQILDEVKFVGGQFEPFGFRNLGKDTRTSAGSKIEPFIGITPAPFDVNMTKAEREAYEIEKGKIPIGSRTKEQAQHSQDKVKLRNDYMASKDPGALDQAVDAGTITSKERREIIKDASLSRLERVTKYLSFEEVNHLLKLATKEERPELEKILEKKRAGKEKRGTWTQAEEEIYNGAFKSQE